VLYHEDIDLTKMNNLAKVEEQHKDTYLMQSNKKAQGKVTGIFIIHPSTTRNYYDEEIIDRDGHHLPTWNQYAKVFSKRC
jgi:hypothetical protein